ncbi:hypothetical protein L6164_018804 [Bauhinia variegata]|uniref:Uncharacterized protein n=1 Tax=Bauhinia variegata TaxID=167791 RepID=A0ACB9NDR0_BAUVA|nr:hypothetical protein L6164_018804 [Bauhinia variegata]
MKFFSELKSCYRPQGNPASPAPPSADDGHRVPPDLQRINRSRVRRYRSRHWRPALSAIIEDQDSSQDRKSDKKSSGKSRSTGKIRCSYQSDHCTGNPNPMTVSFAGFAATPFMF